MSDIDSVWCYACRNCSREIPSELIHTASLLSKEYKHIVYCKKLNVLVVANDNMYIDKSSTCEMFNTA